MGRCSIRWLLCLVSLPGLLGRPAHAVRAKAVVRQFELRTTDTAVRLFAGDSAPELRSLGTRGGVLIARNHSQELLDRVRVNGKWQMVSWRRQKVSRDATGRSLDFAYAAGEPRLRLHWLWRARADFGPVEHRIVIDNQSRALVCLPLQDTLDLTFEIPSGERIHSVTVEKGGATPSTIGTHFNAVAEGHRWTGTSSTFADNVTAPEAREIIPFYLAEVMAARRIRAWYTGLEFSGRVRLTLERHGGLVASRVGLNPVPGPYLTCVGRGRSFETPEAFLGAISLAGSDAVDATGNVLRHWVAAVLQNPQTIGDVQYPLLVNNSWGGGLKVDDRRARAMIAEDARLGLEMFHIDAGWFRGVGDWHPDVKKFPQGLATVADEAHARGLKFGLWVDWTQAGIDRVPGALNAHDPRIRDWLTRDVPANWRPGGWGGVPVDIGDPRAARWCDREVNRMVRQYHLDMLEHDGYLVADGCDRRDHPHVTADPHSLTYFSSGYPRVMGPNSTDVSYYSTRAYYSIYEGLRRRHPGLYLEACNDGGHMVDFGTAAHVDYFAITDTYDPLSNRRAFFDASHVLPPAMLECYIETYPSPAPARWTERNLAEFVYALRSGMMGWATIMQDVTAWNSAQIQAARRQFELYKRALRPLIRVADLYHITARPDGIHWDGIEYFDPASRRGAVFAFRGSTGESRHAFVLRGLNAARRYRLHFADGSQRDQVSSGAALLRTGVAISLALPRSSEIVLIEELR